MKKKLIIWTFAILFISGCSYFESETNIENLEGSVAVKKIMQDKFGKDLKIQKVTLISQQELNTTLDIIQAEEAGNAEDITTYSYITKYEKLSTDKVKNFNKSGNGIVISNIPEDLFYNNAKKVIALTPKDMEFNSIKSYTQEFAADKPTEAEIVIHATPIKGSTALKGNKLETTYYEFTYTIDANGKVTMLSED